MTDLNTQKETAEVVSDVHTHSHVAPDGTIYYHSHDDQSEPGGHPHLHSHSHTQTRSVTNRLSRAIGHLEAVKRMVESERNCTDVLIQLSAVQAALNNTAKIILKDHIQHCMMDAIHQNDQQALDDLNEVIEKFMH